MFIKISFTDSKVKNQLSPKLCEMIVNSEEYPTKLNIEQVDDDLYFKGYFDRKYAISLSIFTSQNQS